MHGAVYLKIRDKLVSDGKDSDWTVSTAAFFLLKTLRHDHAIADNRPLIPHCGHTMWPIATEPDGLYLSGCDIGIDWDLQHSGDTIIHKFSNEVFVETDFEDWRSAVCRFSDEIYAFFITAYPKRIDDDDDRRGFELFMKLWRQFRAESSN